MTVPAYPGTTPLYYRTETPADLPRLLQMQQQTNPLQCPFCLSAAVQTGYEQDIQPDGQLSIAGQCRDCGEEWIAYFQLTDFC